MTCKNDKMTQGFKQVQSPSLHRVRGESRKGAGWRHVPAQPAGRVQMNTACSSLMQAPQVALCSWHSEHHAAGGSSSSLTLQKPCRRSGPEQRAGSEPPGQVFMPTAEVPRRNFTDVNVSLNSAGSPTGPFCASVEAGPPDGRKTMRSLCLLLVLWTAEKFAF